MLTKECEHLAVFGEDKLKRAARERLEVLAHRDHAPRPPEEGRKILLLVLDVDRFVVVLRIDDDRQMQLLRIRFRKTGVAIGRPLHRGAAAIAIAKVNVVAHADLVAVVEHRRSGHGEKQDVQ